MLNSLIEWLGYALIALMLYRLGRNGFWRSAPIFAAVQLAEALLTAFHQYARMELGSKQARHIYVDALIFSMALDFGGFVLLAHSKELRWAAPTQALQWALEAIWFWNKGDLFYRAPYDGWCHAFTIVGMILTAQVIWISYRHRPDRRFQVRSVEPLGSRLLGWMRDRHRRGVGRSGREGLGLER